MGDGTTDCARDNGRDDTPIEGTRDDATDGPLNTAMDKACDWEADVKVEGAEDERGNDNVKKPVSLV